jgi:2-oxo-3-hexenedioate decarboxylase
VQSIFPGWRFTAADTVAAFGLHRAIAGRSSAAVKPEEAAHWCDALAGFEITLSRDGEAADHGRASNVLAGGPLKALRHLVEVLAADQSAPALAACEVISTGTLTRALPITAHETWRTKLTGIALSGVTVAMVNVWP